MKIRIKGNSLRYRLTRPDIAALAKDGYLEERIDFGFESLIYAIKIRETQNLTAKYNDHAITLSMSPTMIAELVETEKVGFEQKGEPLYLLVEKDFTCLDQVEEDQSDNYPNPLLAEKK